VSEAHSRTPEHLRGAFGQDAFGRGAEKAARFFGTPQYIIGQSIVVVLWVVLNSLAWSLKWDPYPFILLNLAFSTQAAYAAPLILLASTRQAARDQAHADAAARHSEQIAETGRRMLEENTRLTQQVHDLTEAIHAKVVA
jgi:uncharacterized membrane protein